MKKMFLLTFMLLLVGCANDQPPVPQCPKIKPLKFTLTVDKRGGFDKKNRIISTKALQYFGSEIRRNNKIVDTINSQR